MQSGTRSNYFIQFFSGFSNLERCLPFLLFTGVVYTTKVCSPAFWHEQTVAQLVGARGWSCWSRVRIPVPLFIFRARSLKDGNGKERKLARVARYGMCMIMGTSSFPLPRDLCSITTDSSHNNGGNKSFRHVTGEASEQPSTGCLLILLYPSYLPPIALSRPVHLPPFSLP
jgi:hypothetical protein